MKTLFKIAFFFVTGLFILSLIGGGVAWHGLGSLGDHASISINGEPLLFEGWHDGLDHGGSWLGAVLGLFIAGLVMCVIVPLVLLLSVGLPLLIVGLVFGIVLLAVAGVGALVFSPFILLALPFIWLARRNSRRAKANIAA